MVRRLRDKRRHPPLVWQSNMADLKTEDTKGSPAGPQKSCVRGQPPGAVDLLIDALNDRDFQIRVYAATALGQAGNKVPVVKPLLKALDDFTFHVRAAAAAALGRIPGQPIGHTAVYRYGRSTHGSSRAGSPESTDDRNYRGLLPSMIV